MNLYFFGNILDLRQDQRIESLFVTCNNLFQRDPGCRKNQLKIVTYKVVPMTSNLGLIEMLPGISLKEAYQLGAKTLPQPSKHPGDEIG